VNIVCISPAPWDYPIWTNRQHIMSRVARDHNVLYVFHPSLLRSCLKRNLLKGGSILKTLVKKHEKLHLYTPFILPLGERFPSIHSLNIRLASRALKGILKRLGFDSYVLWFYDPEAVGYLDQLDPMISCYDCVDDFSSMPSYASAARARHLLNLEDHLVRRSSLVFTTSSELLKKKSPLNRNTFLVENVGDFDHFHRAAGGGIPLPPDLSGVRSPLIAFVGALDDYKVDYDLIQHLARKRPDWTLMLIGSCMGKDDSAIRSELPNILFLGKKNYSELPAYLAQADVCIIPYRINDYTRHVFPLKMFEYMATGKPIVSTELPSLEQYRSVIGMAGDFDSFVERVEDGLRCDSKEKQIMRISIARQHTWESRKDKLLTHVQALLQDRQEPIL
jgi:glycosyltransferase involved in cell wall biosynthesis